MSAAGDLIERLEKETGQRIDDNDGDNLAMAGLFGAIFRLMGESPKSYCERDDVAAGILIKYYASPEYQQGQEANEFLASLLVNGVSPDDIKSMQKSLGK